MPATACLITLACLLTASAAVVPARGSTGDAAYSTRVSNSIAGGDPGYFYVGGPINVTLRDRLKRNERFELCLTPAPIDRRACTSGRTNRTIASLAPSRAGRTKLRFKVLPQGPVIVRYIRVRRPPMR